MTVARTNAAPDISGIRATRAIVDLDAIEWNVRSLRTVLPETCQLMAVVKADGYGHGAPWVARAALDAGAKLLGVATVAEGQILRGHGIVAPIVLLGSITPSEAATACRAALEITVGSEDLLDAVQSAARAVHPKAPIRVHLKIDTGLRRYGATPTAAVALATRIEADSYLSFASMFTHFASADEPEEQFTEAQLSEFVSTVECLRAACVPVPSLHAANSAGVLTGNGTDFDMARPGISLYGVPPSTDVALRPGMRAAMKLESRITRIIPISPGDSVGYNRTFRANESMWGGLVPIGYADGYRRSLSGRAWVSINGKRAPILGRISMDQVVVQIPRGVRVDVGQTVHVFGGDAATGAPSIEQIAELMGTNVYEALVGIRSRVPRVYIRGGNPVAVRLAGEAVAGDL
jgi:alanine racemase